MNPEGPATKSPRLIDDCRYLSVSKTVSSWLVRLWQVCVYLHRILVVVCSAEACFMAVLCKQPRKRVNVPRCGSDIATVRNVHRAVCWKWYGTVVVQALVGWFID